MDQIEWKDEYCIGVGLFDAQHQHLIKLSNELIIAFDEGRDESGIADLMSDLYQHTLAHFDYEERFMLHYGYPDYVAHCRTHREFLRQMEETGIAIHESQFVVKEEHVAMLSNWFIEHITSDDKKYRTFFVRAGLL